MKISQEQINEYESNGFIAIDDVFDEAEVAEMLHAIDSSEEIQSHIRKNDPGFGFHLLEITRIHPTYLKYACHPKIIEIIQSILGENIQLQHSKLTVKMSGENHHAIAWHQDFAYLPHTNTSLLTVMISLVDFSDSNGCMKMVRGSHKLGVLNHRDSNGFESDCTDSWAWEDRNKVVSVAPKRGGISIHHALTLHSSPDNLSEIPRSSVAFCYRSSDAYQLSDKVWNDTGLVVSGELDGHVNIRLEEMSIPLVKSTRYPRFPFGDSYHQAGTLVESKEITSPFLNSMKK